MMDFKTRLEDLAVVVARLCGDLGVISSSPLARSGYPAAVVVALRTAQCEHSEEELKSWLAQRIRNRQETLVLPPGNN
jgi:hypothetical protein